MSITANYPKRVLEARCWGLTSGDKIPRYLNGAKRGETETAQDRAGFGTFKMAERAGIMHNLQPTLILGKSSDGLQLCGYDFDMCVSRGVIDPRVQRIIDESGSYSELSISGNGVHIIGTGSIETWSAGVRPGLEAYSGKRHFVPTGRVIKNTQLLQDIVHLEGLVVDLFPLKDKTQGGEGRNNDLSRYVYSLMMQGISDEEELLLRALQHNISYVPPLEEAEVRQLVRGKIRNVEPQPAPSPSDFPNLGVVEAPHVGVVLRTLDGITPERIDWIWRDGFACGKLHMLAGVAGTGKTTIALNLSAPVTGKGTFPDGSTCPIPGSVVIWSGEDGVADTLVPRLLAAGCDPNKVFLVTGMNLPQGGKRMFDPSRDLESLIKAVRGIGDVRLLIIEPIVMMAKTDSHKNAETRRDLAPLIDLAEELKLAVLGITHFSKGTSGHTPVERLTGSLAFGAAPRIVWTTAVDEEDINRKFLIRAKANICRDGGGFSYTIEQKDIRPGINASFIKWGEAVEGTAKALLNDAEGKREAGRPGNEIAHAKEFLLRALAKGPMKSKDIMEWAEAEMISERTLKRAKKEMPISSTQEKDGWWMSLDPMDVL